MHILHPLPSSDINKILVEYHIKNSLYFEKGEKIIFIMKSAQMQTFFIEIWEQVNFDELCFRT